MQQHISAQKKMIKNTPKNKKKNYSFVPSLITICKRRKQAYVFIYIILSSSKWAFFGWIVDANGKWTC